jgi:hypothetical protein
LITDGPQLHDRIWEPGVSPKFLVDGKLLPMNPTEEIPQNLNLEVLANAVQDLVKRFVDGPSNDTDLEKLTKFSTVVEKALAKANGNAAGMKPSFFLGSVMIQLECPNMKRFVERACHILKVSETAVTATPTSSNVSQLQSIYGRAALNQYREDSQKARSCGGGGNNAETNTPHSSRGRQHQSSLTTLTLVEASKNHPAAASELNKLKKKGAGNILTQGVVEEASKYTISILSSVDNPLAQSVITADYKDFTLASIFDVNLSGCLFEMGVKGSRNEVSSRVFKVIGVAHAMLKVQQPTRFFLGLGNRDKKVSEHNLIAVDLGSPQDLR